MGSQAISSDKTCRIYIQREKQFMRMIYEECFSTLGQKISILSQCILDQTFWIILLSKEWVHEGLIELFRFRENTICHQLVHIFA
jgi:hypothetical protein